MTQFHLSSILKIVLEGGRQRASGAVPGPAGGGEKKKNLFVM